VTVTTVTDAELTVRMRRLAAAAGSFKRWGNTEREAETLAEIRRLAAVRARLRADSARLQADLRLASVGVRYEDYVAVAEAGAGDSDVTGDG
jgi:hypothetical protein